MLHPEGKQASAKPLWAVGTVLGSATSLVRRFVLVSYNVVNAHRAGRVLSMRTSHHKNPVVRGSIQIIAAANTTTTATADVLTQPAGSTAGIANARVDSLWN